MEDKLGISKAGFVRNNFLQNDMMTLQISTGKVGERLGVLGERLIWKHHPINDFNICRTHNQAN